jgi:hypothetical protein
MGRKLEFLSPNWKTTLNFLKMEEDLKLFENGRRPQSFWKWKKTTSKMFENGRRPQIFLKMEDDLKYSKN